MHVQDGTSADSDFSEGGSDGSEHLLSPPSVNLPKGGGAIQGIDEKLSVNPATGTAGLTIPIPVSPGRSGFQPQLRISYDSGNGNGPFGLGWSLSLPRVSRKTAKGLPQYLGDDTYLLSGAEDLVPALEETEKGEWVPVTGGSEEDRRQYEILRYRPRVEGMFARIERWEHRSTKDVHWRSVTKDNTTTIYGASAAARIADPEDRTRIFSWLIEETRDDRGNVIRYSYAEEDAEGVDPGNLHERNRLGRPSAFTNRYLKRVRYGNRRLDPSVDADWMFDVVFDYGEHDDDAPRVEPGDRLWGVRPDPFSSYRSGFEIRTYRRCRRVLVFHRFPELGEAPHLVRALEFEYGGSDDPRFPQYSYLQRVRTRGFRWDAASERYAHRAMPPLEFDYQTARLQEKTPAKIESQVLEDQVGTLLHRGGQWADLDGEGLPGVLSEQGGHWYFRRNFGEGAFGAAEVVNPAPAPVTVAGGREQLLDLAGDGQQDLVVLGETSGFYER
ncbi:MAG: SpvB/TcaC N-terminal domain-containing protein, partial [Pseudomonadota bacterium]|nr:SpvB/TcaC N-terminal domain-containing protein [Pseudomonadota bacterium]